AVRVSAPAGPDVMYRWDRPDAPPPPPIPPVPPVPPVPAVMPVPAMAPATPARPRSKARSLEFYVKDQGKEMRATLPMNLARSAERFLPRPLYRYLEQYEVDLPKLLEIAD